MDNTIVHFEIPADNIKELSKFYSSLFDWKIIHTPVEGMDYWIIQTVPTDDNGMPLRPGVNGGMFARQPEQKRINPVKTKENLNDQHRSCWLWLLGAEPGQELQRQSGVQT